MLPRFLRDRGFGAGAGQRASALPDAPEAIPEQRRWVVHPFLIAVFPIVSLYAHNVYETPSRALWGPLGLSLAGSFAVWLVLRWWSRDPLRAGLATSLLVVLFFSFGRCTIAVHDFLNYLSTFWDRRAISVHPAIMFVLMAIPSLPVLYAIFRRLKHLGAWTGYLNVFAMVLVAMPTLSAARSRTREPVRPVTRAGGGVPTAPRPERLPDIYQIVLDGYARSDVLRDLYGWDNEPFLRRLEKKGFFVARQSTSNYCQTRLSLSSTLNFNYLDTLIDPKSNDLLPLSGLIKDNLVIKSLRPHGYKFVAFATGFEPTDIIDADYFYYPRYPTAEFHEMLIGMTPLRPLLSKSKYHDPYEAIRERTLFILDRLPAIAEMREPTFTLAHIISPHPPFVFGEHGEDISPRQAKPYEHDPKLRDTYTGTPEYFRDAFLKQSIFLSTQVEQTITRILASSPEPPIIILQSDHGSWLHYHPDDVEKSDLRERFGILNCYYVPGRKYEGLTDQITPVNSYRVILNNVFGSNLPMLEERNYFSNFSSPLDFIDVTKRLQSDQDRGRTFTPPPSYPSILLQ